ncbi:unnamed protein product [Amoebophrya sp. A120]|nr:unnamed protein product [Amoebophrya sp. A120]|eukprot:GSA120T00003923001.1
MYMRSEYDRHVSEVVEKLVKPRDAAFRRNTFWRDFSPALPVLGAVAAVGYVCSTACRLCSKAFWQGEKSGAKKTGESRWCQATGDYPLAVATL